MGCDNRRQDMMKVLKKWRREVKALRLVAILIVWRFLLCSHDITCPPCLVPSLFLSSHLSSLPCLALPCTFRDMITEVVEDRTCHYNIKVTHEDKRIPCRALFPFLPPPLSSHPLSLSLYSTLLVTFQLHCFIANALCNDPLCHLSFVSSARCLPLDLNRRKDCIATVQYYAVQSRECVTYQFSILRFTASDLLHTGCFCAGLQLSLARPEGEEGELSSCHLLAFCWNTVIWS